MKLLSSGVYTYFALRIVPLFLPASFVYADTVWGQVGTDIYGDVASVQLSKVHLSDDGLVLATGAPSYGSGLVRVYQWSQSSWTQLGGDFLGDVSGDNFGRGVWVSGDGSTLAVGAPSHDAGGNNDIGYVRVYHWDQSSWSQLGADLVGAVAYEQFGYSVSLSDDGTILAVGARGRSDTFGEVNVYQWNQSSWTQLGDPIIAEASGDSFGISVSLSDDGSTLAVGASNNDGAAQNAGHVRVFTWDQTSWTQLGPDIDGDAVSFLNFGISVSLSGDGMTLAIGAPGTSSGGSARVYTWDQSSVSWVQLGVTIVGENQYDNFGRSVSLSDDGTVLVIGSYGNDGNGNGAGRTYIYTWDGTMWNHCIADIDGAAAGDNFGDAVSVSGDGTFVAIGAPYHDGNGINNSGQVRVFSPPVQSVQTSSGGDPHFIGFNQKLITYQGECTLILLESQDSIKVHVRTTRRLDFSYISGVAMLIDSNIFEVTELNPDLILNRKTVTYQNGNQIQLGTINVTRKEDVTDHNILSYYIDVGGGKKIIIRVNQNTSMLFVATQGIFSRQTQGLLGSPGIKEMYTRDGRKLSDIDDVNVYGESWQVKDTDVQLFQEPQGPQYPQKCIYETDLSQYNLRGLRGMLKKKNEITRQDAADACSSVTNIKKRELCIIDTMATGDIEMKNDPFYLF